MSIFFFKLKWEFWSEQSSVKLLVNNLQCCFWINHSINHWNHIRLAVKFVLLEIKDKTIVKTILLKYALFRVLKEKQVALSLKRASSLLSVFCSRLTIKKSCQKQQGWAQYFYGSWNRPKNYRTYYRGLQAFENTSIERSHHTVELMWV